MHIVRAGKEKGFQDGIEAGREMERAQKEESVRERLMWNAAGTAWCFMWCCGCSDCGLSGAERTSGTRCRWTFLNSRRYFVAKCT